TSTGSGGSQGFFGAGRPVRRNAVPAVATIRSRSDDGCTVVRPRWVPASSEAGTRQPRARPAAVCGLRRARTLEPCAARRARPPATGPRGVLRGAVARLAGAAPRGPPSAPPPAPRGLRPVGPRRPGPLGVPAPGGAVPPGAAPAAGGEVGLCALPAGELAG